MTNASSKRVMIIGAGRVGRAAAGILAASRRYEPVLADISPDALAAAPDGVETLEIGYSMGDFLHRVLPGSVAVLSAAPSGGAQVAEAARLTGCHYVDLADDTSQAHAIAAIAEGAATSFITSCGLAPGYANALLRQVLRTATPQSEILMQVGILPAERSGRLGYANLWGIDGLIAEYTKPCLAIRNGETVSLPPLSEHETLTLEGEAFETFTTAGTLDGLMRETAGQVKSMTFKTLRYPGHLDYMQFLLDDMGLSTRIYALKSLLMNALPHAERDRAIIHISHRRKSGAEPEELLKEFASVPDGSGGWISASSRVSAVHACAVLDVVCSGNGPGQGHHAGDRIELETLQSSPLFDL